MLPAEHAGSTGHHEMVPDPVAGGKCGWHTPAGQQCLTQSILIRARPTLCSELPPPGPLRLVSFLQTHNLKPMSSSMVGTTTLPELTPHR